MMNRNPVERPPMDRIVTDPFIRHYLNLFLDETKQPPTSNQSPATSPAHRAQTAATAHTNTPPQRPPQPSQYAPITALPAGRPGGGRPPSAAQRDKPAVRADGAYRPSSAAPSVQVVVS